MSGADLYDPRLGYVHRFQTSKQISVATKQRHAGADQGLGVVSLEPDLREGRREWNGDGETVGGIVVMRYGQNALTVIDGVKQS